jgi:hypothetical protein
MRLVTRDQRVAQLAPLVDENRVPDRRWGESRAEELKKRLPMLRVKIYDAETKTREEIEPPLACRVRWLLEPHLT